MLQLNLEWLTAVSLLKSDHWLGHYMKLVNGSGVGDCSQNIADIKNDKMLSVGQRALESYQYYAPSLFRSDDLRNSVDRWLSRENDKDPLFTLDRLSDVFMEWRGDGFVSPPQKLELWSALITKIDPIFVLGNSYAQLLHKEQITVPQLVNGVQQCEFAMHKDHRNKDYADNHVHFYGQGSSSLSMVDFALGYCGNDGKEWEWPPMPECTSFENGGKSKDELPKIVWKCANFLISETFGFFERERSLDTWDFHLIDDYTQLVGMLNCTPAHTIPQKLIGASVDNTLPASKRWLCLVTALIYSDKYDNPDERYPKSRWVVRAFVHAANIFRSAMISSGVGLSSFVKYYRSSVRFGLHRTYHQHALMTDNGENIYREYKVNPDCIKPNWLKEQAESLLHLERDAHNHYVIHFLRSLPDLKKRRDRYQRKIRIELRKKLINIANIMSSFELQRVLGANRKSVNSSNAVHSVQTNADYEVFDNYVSTTGDDTFNVLQLVRGIDVAGDENALPIEIFAPTIRALRCGSMIRSEVDEYVPQRHMHLTIHAGEDYSHLISGIRSIDETVNFCGYREGDRIGHALALGVNVFNWASRQQQVYIPAGEHLDNLVWCYHLAHKVIAAVPHLAPAMALLQKKIIHWSQFVWGDVYDPQVLYQAWLLRRNCPQEYQNIQVGVPCEFTEYLMDKEYMDNEVNASVVGLWNLYIGLSFHPCSQNKDEIVCIDLKEQTPLHGLSQNKPLHDTISLMELELVTALQDYLIQQYSNLGIVIEACPTSNIHIGRFNSYDEHPLFRWYPPDLKLLEDGGTYNKFGLRSGPMGFCLNTDDAGVIPTTIINEHRIIKEVAINQFGICAESAEVWINRIRQIGMEAFSQNHIDMATPM
ncbi:MAG: hypothetical protein ACNI27_06280 [Desulfovibrio sp.]